MGISNSKKKKQQQGAGTGGKGGGLSNSTKSVYSEEGKIAPPVSRNTLRASNPEAQKGTGMKNFKVSQANIVNVVNTEQNVPVSGGHVAVNVTNNVEQVGQDASEQGVVLVKRKKKQMSLDPLERVVNVFGISFTFFSIIKLMHFEDDWSKDDVADDIDIYWELFISETANIRNFDRLRDWVFPMHFRKTGAVLGAGRQLNSTFEKLNSLMPLASSMTQDMEKSKVNNLFMQAVGDIFNFQKMCEMTVPTEIEEIIGSIAQSIRDCLMSLKSEEVLFIDAIRILQARSILLAKLCGHYANQFQNMQFTEDLHKSCYLIVKASRLLETIGCQYETDNNNPGIYDNFTNLAKAIVTQCQTITTMTQTTPTQNIQMANVTPERLQAYHESYGVAINDVTVSLNDFMEVADNENIVASVNGIINQLEEIKECVLYPNFKKLLEAINIMTKQYLTLCASIYFFLVETDDQILKEVLMEAMQSSLHNLIIVHIASSSKALHHYFFDADLMLYISFRSFLMSVSIVISTISKLTVTIENETTYTTDEMDEAIVYISHFGRSLFKGEEELLEQIAQWQEDDDDIYEMEAVVGLRNEDSEDSFADPEDYITVVEQPSNKLPITTITTTTTHKNPNYDPFQDDNFLLHCNLDDYNLENLPPGYAPEPFPKPTFDDGTEEEYKQYMRDKYEYEQWENRLIVYKRKLGERITERKKELNMVLH